MDAVWKPQPGPQTEAIGATWCDELFYGGARGGGKSDYLLGDFLQGVQEYGGDWHCVIFRRTNPELEELQKRAKQLFVKAGGTYLKGERTWHFTSGATLKMRHLMRHDDADLYQGHQYGGIYFDELSAWPDDYAYNRLKACLRVGAPGMRKRIRSAGNPGGRGHLWVKDKFIDPDRFGYTPIDDPETGTTQMFIPAKVEDNKILIRNNPNYINQLKGVGSPELVKAWLDGDWEVTLGAYFPEFGMQNWIEPFAVPSQWMKFRSYDWGYSKPFSCGWWAVSDGDPVEDYKGNTKVYPKGAMIRYREYYGASGPNVGLRMTDAQVAKAIVERTGDEQIAYTVADPAIFAADGGPCIAETYRKHGFLCRPADNKRVAGWQQMRGRIEGEDGVPMAYWFKTCKESIRTIPAQQHDDHRPEDMNSEGEDHCFTLDTLVRTSKGVYSFADLLGTKGQTQSHDGQWHDYRSVRLVKRDQPIVSLKFSDGAVIKCTKDHLFLTKLGWIKAENMKGQASLALSQKQSKSLTSKDSIYAANTSNVKATDCIGLFGNTITERFQKAITFITSTMTEAITQYQTSIALQLMPIYPENTGRLLASEERNTYVAPLRQPQLGMEVMRVKSGTKNTTRNIALLSYIKEMKRVVSVALRSFEQQPIASFALTAVSQRPVGKVASTTKQEIAASVSKHSKLINTQKRERAPLPVGPFPALNHGLECLKVSEAGTSDVYCLTVPTTGNFTLANGLIVSNCADESRYAFMSRPWTATKAPETNKQVELKKPTINDLWNAIPKSNNSRIA